MRAHRLAANVFIDPRRIAELAPVRRQFRLVDRRPRKMIGGDVDEYKQWPAVLFAGDRARGLVEIVAVGLYVVGRAEVRLIEEMTDARRGLEAARAEKFPRGGIERDRSVAAAAQRLGQA